MNSPESFSFSEPTPPPAEEKPKRLSLDLPAASQAVLAELEQEKPEHFNPKWIQRRLPNVYAYFTRSMRAGTITDWSEFTAQLPENWKERWTREVAEKWSIEKAKARLLELLEENKPEQFNKKWIINTEPRLYT